MLKKCTYNSQYITHYAQVESIKMLTQTGHNETQLHYRQLWTLQFYYVLNGGYQLIDQLFNSP